MTKEFDEKVIRPQSRVVMHFSLTLEDGTIAESTFDSDPLEFVMGDGTLIEGLELALYGLKPGDHQRLTMQPQDAFGFPDPENVHIMPRSEFTADMEIEPGLIIGFTTPSGEEIPGAVLEVHDDEVKVDFNHPLAGHELVFDVEILEVQSSPVME
jgi:FKBP-type peptidyl-prolyl cis-trans isomerase SlpA